MWTWLPERKVQPNLRRDSDRAIATEGVEV
jgi:hypothetical protein